ncbi:hypothetical protein BJ322DRAFT_1077792 [Thelephora terrestris]|uniref:Uncharacterized protein n=1 Tax=Thelephora terrestris TaxID=56493 RepID=A0A9P6H954_9AGAM|nr:hypothetical protein BJ322DRAFT_1077792 [Thelephora terrestris]
MGFFSSSKTELRAPEHGHALANAANVIRSRFYGKGKERERTAFKNLGNESLPQDRGSSAGHNTLFPGRDAFNKSFGRASGRKVKTNIPAASSTPTSSGNAPSTSSLLVPGPRAALQPSPRQKSRTSADTITMTLAQRLGELATANEQGLLDDDEYRLLRANLFERFTHASTVPSEAPIVRLSVSSHQNSHIPSPSLLSSRPASVQSKASIVSTFSGLLRRVSSSSRRLNPSSGSQPPTSSDSMIPPPTSAPVQSRTFSRHLLRREASDSSLGSEISVYRIGEYQRGGTPTSRKSSHNPPPSSYSFKSATHTPTRDVKRRPPLDEIDLNGEHTQSVKELRTEIEAVEAEGRRLLDAFNGLELSTLTKRQRRPIPLQVSSETDSGSTHSGRSASLRGPRQMATNQSSQPLVSQPITLSRKNSLSSMSSRGRSINGSHYPLPSTTSSNSLGRFGTSTSTGSTPSVNNFSALETVEEAGDPALAMLESEMADIRRRRAEVVARYEAKLELLRAKLKGAEMHEKLLKR